MTKHYPTRVARLLNRHRIYFQKVDITMLRGEKIAPMVVARRGITLVGYDAVREHLRIHDGFPPPVHGRQS